MKPVFLILSFFLLSAFTTLAQTAHDVSGTVVDSTKLSLPGSSIKLVSNTGDSTISIADANGKFIFAGVKGSQITLTISSIGFTSLKKHFALNDDGGKPVDLGNIILSSQTKMLGLVTIVGVTPVTLKEDTVVYNASAYKVRENAPAEDLIKKLPGVDVDVNGNITTQGKQVTKVRINGKDFMGGDVQSATKNLPADVIENIQMIDDYGDQANLTGVKTGEPDKIMNITIRKDKNYGYTAQATAGDGRDALPQSQGVPNKNRYLGTLNIFNFQDAQQVAILGSINNTNVNTFSFGSTGGGGGNSFGGGSGRGNAGRGGGGNSGSLITTQNGIVDAKSIGASFLDQWGKKLTVYGSYSFTDKTVSTTNNIFQQNTSGSNPTLQQQNSIESDESINHRFTWNMEYKPDTINYLKVTPTFSYAGTNTNESDDVSFSRAENVTSAYTSTTTGDSQAPSYGITALYNHKFKNRRNLSITATAGSAPSWSYQNPVYDYTAGAPTASPNQMISTYSRTNNIGTNVSFLNPLGKRSYLELNYAFNHSVTNNNKETDVLYSEADLTFRRDSALSNLYNYTFTTNRVGLNYRFVEKKYNYTLGLGIQPSVLDGNSLVTGVQTHRSTLNVIPTARFIYNFSRSQTFSVNYNGSSSAPSFSQLQPVIDFSNALYPVQGNPDLKPAFTNNISIRYNKFSFTTGSVLFANLSFQSIQNQAVTNTITYPRLYPADTRFQNTILTQYLNANGYYTTTGRVVFSKPWAERKYTLAFSGTATYNNNVGYLTNIDSITFASTTQKNIAKNLVFTPEVRFRVDIPNVIDAQILTNYAINRTSNSVRNDFLDGSANVRTWTTGITGKNYFGNWVVSYDFSRAQNYGYASNIKVTNPNILNLYVERQFLKNNIATLRLSGFDLFNQNTGFSSSTTASSITQTRVNRLARYYLLTFTLRLKKFAGKAPVQEDRGRGFRDGGGNRREGGGPPGGPAGGPPGVPGGPE